MNLYKAVIEFESVKNQPDLTEQEIAEKARSIFDYEKLTAAVRASISNDIFGKFFEKDY